MKSRNQDFALGIVVLAFLALFVGTILFITPRWTGPTKSYTVDFAHDRGVAPLKPESPVLLAGAIQVGKVVEVGPFSKAPQRAGEPRQLLIRVRIAVDDELDLYDDCEITTDQPPVGGGGVVVITSTGKSGRPQPLSQPIRGLPPQSFAAAIGNLSRALLGPGGIVEKVDRAVDAESPGSLMQKLLATLDDVNRITASLKTELSTHEQQTLLAKLHGILDNVVLTTQRLSQQVDAQDGAAVLAKVHTALDHLTTALREIQGLVGENRPVVLETLGHVQSMTRAMDESLTPVFQREFARDDPDSLLNQVHRSFETLNRSLNDVAAITGDTRVLLASNRPAVQRVVDNMKETSDKLRVGVQELLLAPWRLFSPPASELKRLDVFEAARQFAEAASHLDDACLRLEAIVKASSEGGPSASREEIRQVQQGLQAAFERFRNAESYLWEKMK